MPKILKNGILTEVSEEEAKSLSSLAQEQALPGTPITPKGAAGIGGTEQQAAMAGTKAQKTEALRLDIAPKETLSEQQRKKQARQALTEEESIAEQKAQKLRQLGSLQSRVDTIIEEQFSQQTEGAARLTAQVDELPEEQQEIFSQALETYQAALTTLQENPDDEAAQLAVNNTLVNLQQASGGILETADDVRNYLSSIEESVGGSIAGQIADTITLADINTQDLGLTDEEMVGLLGENWQQMTVPELQQAVENIRQQEFSQVQQLQQELADETTSTSRRSEILRQIRDLGQLGVAGAEVQVADIERGIEEADTVVFADEEMSIEELLDNERISDQISLYLSLPDDSEAKQQMAEQLGEDFTNWINQHQGALEQLSDTMTSAEEAFNKLQEMNAEVSDLGVIGQIDEEFLKDIFPDFGEWSSQNYGIELENQEWYKMLNLPEDQGGVTQDEKMQFLESLNNKKLDSDFAKELSDLSKKEVKNLMKDPELLKDYMSYRSQYIPVDELTEEQQNDTDFLMDYLFGEDTLETAEIEDIIKQYRTFTNTSRYGDQYRRFKPFIDNNDNLDPDKILDYLKQRPPKKEATDIKNYLAGNKPEYSRFGRDFDQMEVEPNAWWADDAYNLMKSDNSQYLNKNQIESLMNASSRWMNETYPGSETWELLDNNAKQQVRKMAYNIARNIDAQASQGLWENLNYYGYEDTLAKATKTVGNEYGTSSNYEELYRGDINTANDAIRKIQQRQQIVSDELSNYNNPLVREQLERVIGEFQDRIEQIEDFKDAATNKYSKVQQAIEEFGETPIGTAYI